MGDLLGEHQEVSFLEDHLEVALLGEHPEASFPEGYPVKDHLMDNLEANFVINWKDLLEGHREV
jgi:hypothetical protein